jgi:hypothetical protein
MPFAWSQIEFDATLQRSGWKEEEQHGQWSKKRPGIHDGSHASFSHLRSNRSKRTNTKERRVSEQICQSCVVEVSVRACVGPAARTMGRDESRKRKDWVWLAADFSHRARRSWILVGASAAFGVRFRTLFPILANVPQLCMPFYDRDLKHCLAPLHATPAARGTSKKNHLQWRTI